MYSARLRDIEGIQLPPEMPWAANIFWLYTIVLNKSYGLTAAELAGKLAADGIDTRSIFLPMHALPMYATRKKFPISAGLAQNGLSLPSSPLLDEDDIDRICEVIKKANRGK